VQPFERGVDGGVVPRDHLGAAPAVGLGDRRLDLGDRLSRGSTPEIAKKQVCSTVLVRPARPAARAIRPASIA
jgi:hypothetical protein